MSFRSRLLVACTAWGLGSFSACDIGYPIGSSLDTWCGELLCGWQVDHGETQRISTWHEKQYGLALLGDDAQVSYLSSASTSRCVSLIVTADVETGAQLSLQLDFNDDGVIEYEHVFSPQVWGQRSILLSPPADYKNVRFIMRKAGEGQAAFARFVLHDHGVQNGCYANATRVFIPAGGACTTDASCASGLCTVGHCSACGAQSDVVETGTHPELALCEEGAECARDVQCEGGVCSGGLCQRCALDGTCAAFARCNSDAQCQSGACVPRLSFSDVQEAQNCLHCESDLDCGGTCVRGVCETCSLDPFPKQCAECVNDTQCDSGYCSFGVCVSCLDDTQCQEGERCRFADRFDVGKRECTEELSKNLPRAALCEADSECAAGLSCGASKGEPKRCGIACELDPRVCGKNQLCTRPGLHDSEGFVRFPHYPLPVFEETQGRIATCHERLWNADAPGEVARSFHAECTPGFCCEGVCVSAEEVTPNYRTGGCMPPRYYP